MRNLQILAIALMIAGACSISSAAEFAEDFESYAAGSALHGQGGWKGWDNNAAYGSPTSASYAFSGLNSVEIIGAADKGDVSIIGHLRGVSGQIIGPVKALRGFPLPIALKPVER